MKAVRVVMNYVVVMEWIIQPMDRWITQYSQEGLRHKLMRIQKPEEQERVRELEAQVAALEKALAQVTLDKMMLETTLEVAEEE